MRFNKQNKKHRIHDNVGSLDTINYDILPLQNYSS